MQKQLLFRDTARPGHGSGGFTLHEMLRVLVPGFYFSTLLALFYFSFLHKFFPSDVAHSYDVILFIFAMIVSGLTMYAKESPKRRRAFIQNQPSQFLLERSRTMKSGNPLSDDDARRLYFYILNNHMPAAFHEKIFFFGTVYHIMVLIRRTSFWFGLVCFVALGLEISQGASLADMQGLAIVTIAILFIYVLNVRYNKADRKMQENYQDQIFWLEMNRELVEELIRTFRSTGR
ncbi:MAG TPA: hypothetical protein VNN76_00245 [Bacteroidota bacterium]|nr:hypothetical protein [Bacteroidota bacterium]